MCEYNVYAQCVQLGIPRSRSIALEGRLMDCLHGLPLQEFIYVCIGIRLRFLFHEPKTKVDFFLKKPYILCCVILNKATPRVL
jgi:hypothetical protein